MTMSRGVYVHHAFPDPAPPLFCHLTASLNNIIFPVIPSPTQTSHKQIHHPLFQTYNTTQPLPRHTQHPTLAPSARIAALLIRRSTGLALANCPQPPPPIIGMPPLAFQLPLADPPAVAVTPAAP